MKHQLSPVQTAIGIFIASTGLSGQIIDLGPTSTTVASTCTMEPASVARAYTYKAALGSTSGLITARCPVTNPMNIGQPEWNNFRLLYLDPDGQGGQTAIVASLKRVQHDNGAESVIATFNSNTSPRVVVATGEVWLNHVFNFTTHSYWVELTLVRPTTPLGFIELQPTAYIIRLSRLVVIR